MKNSSSLGEKITIILFAVLLVLALQQTGTLTQPLSAPGETVKHYFDAWNSTDFAGMYGDISDGFKKIEPTASNLSEFKKLIESSRVNGVEILLINTTSNDGTSADVYFSVVYNVNGTKAPSKSNFILRYKQDDKIPGWKIIQPYGAKADKS